MYKNNIFISNKELLYAIFSVYENGAGYIFDPFLFANFVTGITLPYEIWTNIKRIIIVTYNMKLYA